jgi:hypothetical protein
VSVSSSWSKGLKALAQTLDERADLLGLQEMDLEMCEAILAEELECGLHPLDGHDLPMELGESRAWVDGIDDDRVVEAGQLSRQLMRVASVLIDLGLLPIEQITQLSKANQDVLLVVAFVLKRLQEALNSGTGLWD